MWTTKYAGKNGAPNNMPLKSENLEEAADFDMEDTRSLVFGSGDGFRAPIFNIVLYPFHHLLSAARMIPAETPSDKKGEERRRLFWQSLAAHGVTASEAALLSDSLNCHFIERAGDALVEIDWEVMYRDDLAGCAEIYRAELFTWKRLLYGMGKELGSVIEINGAELPEFSDTGLLNAANAGRKHRLFLDNLFTPFEFAISLTKSRAPDDDSSDAANNNKKLNNESDSVGGDHYYSYESKRIESWIAVPGNKTTGHRRLSAVAGDDVMDADGENSGASEFGGTLYRFKLDAYWRDWQRAALISGFDFGYLETIADARALRFYELTKLWRAGLVKKKGAGVPKKMEIEYAKFAALMPLPLVNSEREIRRQIALILEPFKTGGYLKSFAVKPDPHRNGSRYARLLFRFDD